MRACLMVGMSAVLFACPGGGFDENATYSVKVVSAEISATNNGTAWDADSSAPDVMATLNCGATTGQTSVVESYTPTWADGACTDTGKNLIANGVTVQLFDSDLTVNDTITGVQPYTIDETALTSGSAEYGATGAATKVRLSFTVQ